MHLPSVISIALMAYWTTLVVELIGDKAIYTITSFASRYSLSGVYIGVSIGVSIALAGKIVADGNFIRDLVHNAAPHGNGSTM
jgi:hypothetical protein